MTSPLTDGLTKPRRCQDWLREALSSSSLRLRSNRSASDSRTDGTGWRVTASNESLRSCLRESSHWLFLEDCWINSALCCWSTANNRWSWFTWGGGDIVRHQSHDKSSDHLWAHLVLQFPHSAAQLLFFFGATSALLSKKHFFKHWPTHKVLCVCACVCVCS